MGRRREIGAAPPAEVIGVEDRGDKGDYRQFLIHTQRGPIASRLYEASGAPGGVIMVGGVGGGFDSPARGLYARLSEHLVESRFDALRVRFRHPTILDEAAHDVLAGIRVLADRGVSRVGLVGHSFGGAAVILAGASAPEVGAVVALSPQSYGTDAAPQLAPRPLLLIHGTADRVLPPSCSVYIYQRARPPKDLRVLEGAGHGLDEAADEILSLLRDWLTNALLAPRP